MNEKEPTIEEIARELSDSDIEAVAREKTRRQEWICTECSMVLDGLEFAEAGSCPGCGKDQTYIEIRRNRT